MSYFDRPYLSRVANSGSINLNCNTRGTGASDIAIGSDAVYFSDASTGNIGRMAIRRGTGFTCEESTLSTSGLSAGRLSAGPSGTDKLFVQYPSNNYGIVTVPVQVRNYVLASMSALSDVQTVGQEPSPLTVRPESGKFGGLRKAGSPSRGNGPSVSMPSRIPPSPPTEGTEHR